MDTLKVAVLIPCLNEENTIGNVVESFKQYMPSSDIYVFDNNSSDKTLEIARLKGAIVKTENKQGKGAVIRRMFSDVEADVYVLVDGDYTYDSSVSLEMVNYLVEHDLDMLIGSRVASTDDVYRRGHRFGNYILTGLVRLFFGSKLTDTLSGYKLFSRRYVKTFPAKSNGFEIETELTVHALEMNLPIDEIPTEYTSRPTDSVSKLSTYKDGIKIFLTIIKLLFAVKPVFSYLFLSLFFLLFSLIVGWVQVLEPWLEFDEITKISSVVLAASLMLVSVLCLFSGIILNSVSRVRKDNFRLSYLSFAHNLNLKKNQSAPFPAKEMNNR